jgi:hypothetical protein
MNNTVAKSATTHMNKELLTLASHAGNYGWIILATPAAIYLIDKLYALCNDVMDKGYTFGLQANTDGVELKLAPQTTAD